MSGTSHGLQIQGVDVPLDLDLFTLVMFANASSAVLGQTAGQLSGAGNGAAALHLWAGPWNPILLGQSLDFACAFADAGSMDVLRASNGVQVTILH